MPIGPQQIERLTTRLWLDEENAAFALLDGAGIPKLLDKLYGEGGPEFECLYTGELAPDIAEVAPYIVRLEPGSLFLDWLFSRWGQNWGVFAVVPAKLELAAVRRHFRKLNIVYGPNGSPLLFRYYDPRVLGIFASSCNGKQLRDLFGPVRHFILESENPNEAHILSVANGELVQEILTLK
ncbi:MAG: DUF4123 domain-containing protein [Rhodocyclaceae bacterium]|nr:DUF4123 domain-containing protein [Rhodocyclaceae bacterium]